MHRRKFLQSSFIGLTALQWFGCAGPQMLPEDELTQPEGNSFLAKAASVGKPLLVLLVPEAKGERNLRGQEYGDFLVEAADQDVALLGLCEIVCASRKTLAKMVPEVKEDDWMVLLETDGESPAHRIGRPDNEYRKLWKPAKMGELLRSVLFADGVVQKRRAEQCKKVNKGTEALIVSYMKKPSQQPLAIFDRGAALMMQAYEQRALEVDPNNLAPFDKDHYYFATATELRDERLLKIEEDPNAVPQPESFAFLVASAATARLLKTPPEGSEWYTSEPIPCPGCGMGNISRGGRKFLQFLTELPEAI